MITAAVAATGVLISKKNGEKVTLRSWKNEKGFFFLPFSVAFYCLDVWRMCLFKKIYDGRQAISEAMNV